MYENLKILFNANKNNNRKKLLLESSGYFLPNTS